MSKPEFNDLWQDVQVKMLEMQTDVLAEYEGRMFTAECFTAMFLAGMDCGAWVQKRYPGLYAKITEDV